MRERSRVAQKFIDDEIDQALRRAGLPRDHVVRELLNRTAVITGVRDPVVRVKDEFERTFTLDDRIESLRRDAEYRDSMRDDRPRVDPHDLRKLSQNLSDIASGKVRVG